LTVKICVSIMPKSLTEALKLIEKCEKYGADFIEVRLDCLTSFKGLKDVAGCTRTPLIATVRQSKCGRKFSGKEEERVKILLDVASKGFEYADVELNLSGLKIVVENLWALGVKPIISFHDFEKTPKSGELQRILKSEIEAGADVCKIVTTAQSLQDNLALLQFLYNEGGKAKIVCFAMGPLGKPSRLLSPIYGGYFTIASLERGMETAAGQITIEEMKAAYKALGVM
jgi:3-dehydroquinate dehydratase type I